MIVKGSSKCEPDVMCCCCENFSSCVRSGATGFYPSYSNRTCVSRNFHGITQSQKFFNVGYHAKFLYENQVSNWFSSDFKMSSVSLIAPICLLNVNNRNTGTRCEICSVINKDGVVVVSLFLTVNIFRTLFYC